MARYAIWDRKTNILTYTGKVFTPEQWITRHPILGIESIVPVCGGGEINGSYMGTLGDMVARAEREGCDFSACTTNEEKLAAIEAFEDAMNAPSTEPTPEERQAAALEAIATGATKETTEAMMALAGLEV